MSEAPVRVSRAQRRRDKKAAAEQERIKQIEAAEAEAEEAPGPVETRTIRNVLAARGLKLRSIAPDGDCLYGALADQLVGVGKPYTVPQLRAAAARRLRAESDRFAPFMCQNDSGDMLSPAQFESYCDDLENGKPWGGQVELEALAAELRLPIQVITADCAPIQHGTSDGPPLIITYHRHLYRLGEHYNSTAPLDSSPEDCPD